MATTNFVRTFHDEVGHHLVDSTSSLLNENRNGIEKALRVIEASIMGAIIQKGSTERGAQELIDVIHQDNYNGGLIDNTRHILHQGGQSLENLLDRGRNLVHRLLGDSRDGFSQMVANYSGISPAAADSLLHMTAPLEFSLLGRRVQRENLGTGGLMHMLSRQKEYLRESIPSNLAGIGTLLGFSGDLADLGSASGTSTLRDERRRDAILDDDDIRRQERLREERRDAILDDEDIRREERLRREHRDEILDDDDMRREEHLRRERRDEILDDDDIRREERLRRERMREQEDHSATEKLEAERRRDRTPPLPTEDVPQERIRNHPNFNTTYQHMTEEDVPDRVAPRAGDTVVVEDDRRLATKTTTGWSWMLWVIGLILLVALVLFLIT